VPVEIVWSPIALERLREIQTYIAVDSPAAAERMASRILAVVEALKLHPHLGHPSAEPEIRELVIGGTPFIILYRVKGQRVTINTIWHGAQRKKE
jgi:toxin ParE1/3/4